MIILQKSYCFLLNGLFLKECKKVYKKVGDVDKKSYLCISFFKKITFFVKPDRKGFSSNVTILKHFYETLAFDNILGNYVNNCLWADSD